MRIKSLLDYLSFNKEQKRMYKFLKHVTLLLNEEEWTAKELKSIEQEFLKFLFWKITYKLDVIFLANNWFPFSFEKPMDQVELHFGIQYTL